MPNFLDVQAITIVNATVDDLRLEPALSSAVREGLGK